MKKSNINNITLDERSNVVIALSNGTTMTIPKEVAFDFAMDLLPYLLNASDAVDDRLIMAIAPESTKIRIEPTPNDHPGLYFEFELKNKALLRVAIQHNQLDQLASAIEHIQKAINPKGKPLN